MGEFNQCQGQLKDLYQIYKLPGHIDEFMGYRILYMIHTNNKTGKSSDLNFRIGSNNFKFNRSPEIATMCFSFLGGTFSYCD